MRRSQKGGGEREVVKGRQKNVPILKVLAISRASWGYVWCLRVVFTHFE